MIDGSGVPDSYVSYLYDTSDYIYKMNLYHVSVLDIMDGGLIVGGSGVIPALYATKGCIWAGGDMTNYGDAWFGQNVSASSFTDRTPFFEGDALSEIIKIKGKNGQIDHETLPDFVRKKIKDKKINNDDREIVIEETGRDIGAMVSMLTVAVQQLSTEIEKIKKDKK